MILAAAILGSALNVIRGGALPWFKVGKPFHVLAFGVLAALYMPPEAPLALAEWLRLPLTYEQAMFGQFILASLCMWGAQALSWGEEVGQEGILGGNREARDNALVRGAYWGMLLCIPAWSLWPLLYGTTLGICFEIGRILQARYGINGWRCGEAVYGAVMWGACYV